MNYHKWIAWITAIFVAALTVVSIILTYNALYDVAYDNGLTGMAFGFNLAYLWPLTIDGALIVFSMAVVNASLSDDSTWRRWIMVGVFTLLTIVFNIVDGGTDKLPAFIGQSLPFVVRVVPPIALVLSFETLMSMLRKSVKQRSMSKSIEQLSGEMSQLKRTVDKETRKRDKLLSEVDELTVTSEVSKMTEKEKRLSELPDLIDSGLSVEEIAKRWGVQERTVYRYLNEVGLSVAPRKNGTAVVEAGSS